MSSTETNATERDGMKRATCMVFSLRQRIKRQRFDAASAVDLLGDLEGRIQLADAVLLHQLKAFRLLFRLGLSQRQVQAGRNRTEQHFHALGEDDALGELARLLAGRQHQGLLRRVQLAEARDLLHLVRWHREADPPLDHVEHGLGRFGQVVDVLRCQPVPSAELAPHLRDLHDVGREQRVLGDDVAFVRHVDDRPTQELVALGDVVHRVDETDVRDRELRVVALARERGEVHDGDVGLGPGRAGPIEHLAVDALAKHIHRVRHLQQARAAHLGQR
mmetsp:Transcript_26299/g.62388  ORF Transcript_26299/g.62388 Transcript_26299/m.62388 type:complete len:276 (+) Transcript_26299:192-1019(+)